MLMPYIVQEMNSRSEKVTLKGRVTVLINIENASAVCYRIQHDKKPTFCVLTPKCKFPCVCVEILVREVSH